MIRYTFTQQKKYDILPDKIIVYFDEQEGVETITHKDKDDKEVTESHPTWSYLKTYADILDKNTIVNAIIRTRFPQDEVEAIFRHKLEGVDNGEFDTFNEYAEWAKTEAVKILS